MAEKGKGSKKKRKNSREGKGTNKPVEPEKRRSEDRGRRFQSPPSQRAEESEANKGGKPDLLARVR